MSAIERVLLRPREVVELGYAPSEVSLWRMRKRDDFPKAIRLGPNSIAFRRADLDAWLAAQQLT